MKKIQLYQEDQYIFPYHYIPKIEQGIFYQFYNLSWGYEYLSYLNFVISLIKKNEFQSLLDVGCGDGRLSFELGKISPEKKIVGADYSEKAVGMARAMNGGMEFVVGNIKNDGLFQDKFDIITLIETLEHIPLEDVKGFVTAIASRLSKDGILILTVPSKNISLNKKHYQHFNYGDLKKYLGDDFEIVECHYINRTEKSIRLRFLKKLLTNDFFILNNRWLLRKIYGFYQSNLLMGNKKNTRRICVVAKKKQ